MEEGTVGGEPAQDPSDSGEHRMSRKASRFSLGTPLFALAFAALCGAVLTGHQGPPRTESEEHFAAKPFNVPVWQDYAPDFPGCSSTKVLGDVVLVDRDGRARRIGFDRAWALTHDRNTSNDGWVVGWCR